MDEIAHVTEVGFIVTARVHRFYGAVQVLRGAGLRYGRGIDLGAAPTPHRPPMNAAIAQRVVQVVAKLCQEIRPEATTLPEVTLDSSLEGELGLDSLAKVELLMRLERELAVGLPQRTLEVAETPRDLLRAVEAASGRAKPGLEAAHDTVSMATKEVPSPRDWRRERWRLRIAWP